AQDGASGLFVLSRRVKSPRQIVLRFGDVRRGRRQRDLEFADRRFGVVAIDEQIAGHGVGRVLGREDIEAHLHQFQRARLVAALALQLRQLFQRLVIVLGHLYQRFQRSGELRLVAAVIVNPREQFGRGGVAGQEGEELNRTLQKRGGLVVIVV